MNHWLPGPEARRTCAAVAVALLAGLALIACVSREPLRAWLILLTGPLPELRADADGWHWHRLVRFGTVLEDTVSLTFLGLAVLLPLRARQFALGADGQMFLGALAACAISLAVGGPAWLVLPLACAAAMVAGALWGGVTGVLKLRWGANELVVSLMLNLIAVEFYRLAVLRWLRDPTAGFQATPALPDAATLAPLLANTNVTWMLLAAPLAAYATVVLLQRTTLGYEIRVTGSAPAFAAQFGLPVRRALLLSMMLGGAWAGLAGFHLGNALLKRLPVDLTPGLGLEGLLVALLARHEPRAIVGAALFYAWLRAGGQAMERSTDVSREIAIVIQALVILLVVARRWPLPARLRGLFAGAAR
ncbi:simple sugar transport system permease protein [Pseudoduganella flava]|uniref:ABC transporter permease n=1 Tax=Pseudoduganella flava TaxID=871742 RepID=A0A562PDN8_9BURK|nr:ABC transporter permease [Pseudoduganella flava]QGZ42112.1 ABC transporter permease [Pseudoduganella flava]TWI42518.1 simple sugar transport system permease protein [Pseudoduganella flava]